MPNLTFLFVFVIIIHLEFISLAINLYYQFIPKLIINQDNEIIALNFQLYAYDQDKLTDEYLTLFSTHQFLMEKNVFIPVNSEVNGQKKT